MGNGGNMEKIEFIDEQGTFCINNPENYNNLYFPIAGEQGIKSAVTPNLGGDSKLDQNTFILEPVSVENLHNNRSGRNFWCRVENQGIWSAVGASAEAEYQKFSKEQDESELIAGLMWQCAIRKSKKYGLKAKVISFVPIDYHNHADVSNSYFHTQGKLRLKMKPQCPCQKKD